MRIIFVRRGDFGTFKVLEEQCSAIQDVEVRWDRRCGDDRRRRQLPAPADRRARDRRNPPPSNWALSGYTVVEIADPAGDAIGH